MAISMTPEMQKIKDRMHRAASPAEYEHYAHLLDREMQRHSYYDANLDMMRNTAAQQNAIGQNFLNNQNATQNSMGRSIADYLIPEPVTPLSFLSKADKKLLLTGEAL